MNERNHRSRASFGNSRQSALGRLKCTPCESCGGQIPAALRYRLCPVCWQAEKACEQAGVLSLHELADPAVNRDALVWRVSDLVRRAQCEDSDRIIRALERLLA